MVETSKVGNESYGSVKRTELSD